MMSVAELAIGNSWLFNQAIGPLVKLAIPNPKPETEGLESIVEFAPKKDEFQKIITFSKTSERKNFDNARRKLIKSISKDVVNAVLAKHTTEDSEIGKDGKEFNLQKFIITSLNNAEILKNSAVAMKEYLEALEKPVQDPVELKSKRDQVEATKGASIACTLELYQSLCNIVARSENAQLLLHTIDEKVLPDLLANPLDLEKTPVHEWLQHRVLSHLDL
jgi:hypothetical protein